MPQSTQKSAVSWTHSYFHSLSKKKKVSNLFSDWTLYVEVLFVCLFFLFSSVDKLLLCIIVFSDRSYCLFSEWMLKLNYKAVNDWASPSRLLQNGADQVLFNHHGNSKVNWLTVMSQVPLTWQEAFATSYTV